MLMVVCLVMLSASAVFAADSTIKQHVCYSVAPSTLQTKIVSILRKIGIKNAAAYQFVNKIFHHQAVKSVAKQINSHC